MLGGQNGEEGKEVEDQVSGEKDGAQDRQEKEGEEGVRRIDVSASNTLEGLLALVGEDPAERNAPPHLAGSSRRRRASAKSEVSPSGFRSRIDLQVGVMPSLGVVPYQTCTTGREANRKRNDPARTDTAHAVLRRLQSPFLRSAPVFAPFADALGKPNGTVCRPARVLRLMCLGPAVVAAGLFVCRPAFPPREAARDGRCGAARKLI